MSDTWSPVDLQCPATAKYYNIILGCMIKILGILLTYQYANTLIIFLKNNQILIFDEYPVTQFGIILPVKRESVGYI